LTVRIAKSCGAGNRAVLGVDNNAAVYKKELQYRANSFVLRPGNGVHVP